MLKLMDVELASNDTANVTISLEMTDDANIIGIRKIIKHPMICNNYIINVYNNKYHYKTNELKK